MPENGASVYCDHHRRGPLGHVWIAWLGAVRCAYCRTVRAR